MGAVRCGEGGDIDLVEARADKVDVIGVLLGMISGDDEPEGS